MKEINNTGLLIIDVQVAMFSDQDFPLYKGDQLIENICYLLDKARATNKPVFFVQHTGTDEGGVRQGKAYLEN